MGNGMNDELIRKQDALDAAIKADMENHNGVLSEKKARAFDEHIAILPTVQPEMTDEQFKEYCRKRCLSVVTNEFTEDVRKMVPPVQTEPLTDYEQRIFLAAMEKERAVCKKLADEWDGMKLDVPCPVNLLQLCDEVERKVKAALWTN